MNSYQRRLGLVLGATVLLVLLISSSSQSAISYIQFANAYAQSTNKCRGFPNPMQIIAGLLSGETPFLQNSSSKWDSGQVIIKSFSISGFSFNATALTFSSLSMKVLTTHQSFINDSGKITKWYSANSTYAFQVNGFSARFNPNSIAITARHGEGNFTGISTDNPRWTITVSGDNLKSTISCGVT